MATARPKQIKTCSGFQNPLAIYKPALRLKQNNRCFWCGHPMVKQAFFVEGKLDGRKETIDHVIPLCDGGSNDKDNLVLACADCNGLRAANHLKPLKREITELTIEVNRITLDNQKYQEENVALGQLLIQADEDLKRLKPCHCFVCRLKRWWYD
jgi:hypothetical protein